MDARSLASPPPAQPSKSGVRFRLNSLSDRLPNTASASGQTFSPDLNGGRPGRLLRQRLRIQQFQRRWENIKEDLPPQLSRSHIGMISIGGVIGTGLFLGSGQALYNGGPIGALLGYSIIGTVVYCLCVSIGEMIAYLPNVGGVVGLADLFVDPALGFSLGWAAWYNWCVTLPTEISAATILVRLWDPDHRLPVIVLSTIFLAAATAVNCFPSRVYGEFEFWFSAIKVLTIVLIICIVVDLGGGNKGFIGIRHWETPFREYENIPGPLGHFLGFWAVLLQACFSFFGSEVPGIAAGEVIDATRNVPRALQRVWIRITIFYVGAVFCAGLVVDSSDPRLSSKETQKTAQSSPFVIAFEDAGIHVFPSLINAAILLSAWSAASSDIYIGSRFLFFLAKNHHAPEIFAYLRRYPREDSKKSSSGRDNSRQEEEDLPDIDELDDDELQMLSTTASASASSARERRPRQARHRYTQSRQDQDGNIPEEDQQSFHDGGFNSRVAEDGGYTSSPQMVQVTITPADEDSDKVEHEHREYLSDHDDFDDDHPPEAQRDGSPSSSGADPESQRSIAKKQPSGPWFVLPLYAVLATAAVGLLSFMGAGGTNVQTVFGWLSAVASIASLQSWVGMLFTYIRWHRGTIYHEKKHRAGAESGDERSIQVMRNIARIKKNRHRGQPYLAWYAFIIGMLILFTNGWAVFLRGWRIANVPDVDQGPKPDVATFLASYIPLPFFALLTLGYKIIHQTKLVQLDEMDFEKVYFVPPEEDERPPSRRERILGHLLVI
ncbi:amino acid permease-domain-containing protein [Irpex rosettiformis]|uniref:Amino acid permease-domain-containing protein n=1 Tax=Irpex rosettiformis TaxID=378272 RepID=A0ACB8U2Q7_9APHY|nr:amino acid permease-domain-containing protein [Irpex rosettiformis]